MWLSTVSVAAPAGSSTLSFSVATETMAVPVGGTVTDFLPSCRAKITSPLWPTVTFTTRFCDGGGDAETVKTAEVPSTTPRLAATLTTGTCPGKSSSLTSTVAAFFDDDTV